MHANSVPSMYLLCKLRDNLIVLRVEDPLQGFCQHSCSCTLANRALIAFEGTFGEENCVAVRQTSRIRSNNDREHPTWVPLVRWCCLSYGCRDERRSLRKASLAPPMGGQISSEATTARQVLAGSSLPVHALRRCRSGRRLDGSYAMQDKSRREANAMFNAPGKMTAHTSDLLIEKAYVNGEWVDADSGNTFEVTSVLSR